MTQQALTGLTALEWTQGSVGFRATKMDAVSAWDIWVEVIEPELSRINLIDTISPIIKDAISAQGGDTPQITEADIGIILGRTLLSISPQVKKRLRVLLFPTVAFTTVITPSPQPLVADAERMAFATLEPSDIYKVLLQLIAINFTPSFATLFRNIDLMTPDSTLPSAQPNSCTFGSPWCLRVVLPLSNSVLPCLLMTPW